ncbi:hypothetical protein SmJEL517_g01605 [Synchytrium microbalum]|uniref:50S ribosomal protein L35 n=1 Tax=Synchytrium microbalum TaxID=1806994 RepID=A0A507C9N7_9FUNG|nr:uncharacterized protein SmJEL517_g01605 [Synchytrium microbalum]TPX36191.1 hypothetical protein SmJEL517_g01605 [Synchytrium microbalum]
MQAHIPRHLRLVCQLDTRLIPRQAPWMHSLKTNQTEQPKQLRSITSTSSIHHQMPHSPCTYTPWLSIIPPLLYRRPTSNALTLVNQVRTKKTEGRTIMLNSARVKEPSKRKGKKYKLKNHQAAVKRWIVMANGMFKRAQAGKRHLNSKMRAWKRKAKRRRVLATGTQRRMLRRLVPYYRKRYMKE